MINIQEYGQGHYIVEAEELQYLLWIMSQHIERQIEEGNVYTYPDVAQERADEYSELGYQIMLKRHQQAEEA
jgi:hypothetical protein